VIWRVLTLIGTAVSLIEMWTTLRRNNKTKS
jgi:hypothetical protein